MLHYYDGFFNFSSGYFQTELIYISIGLDMETNLYDAAGSISVLVSLPNYTYFIQCFDIFFKLVSQTSYLILTWGKPTKVLCQPSYNNYCCNLFPCRMDDQLERLIIASDNKLDFITFIIR